MRDFKVLSTELRLAWLDAKTGQADDLWTRQAFKVVHALN